MLTWVTELFTAAEGATSPIVDIAGMALKAPFSYFIGLALVGAVIGIVKSVRRA